VGEFMKKEVFNITSTDAAEERWSNASCIRDKIAFSVTSTDAAEEWWSNASCIRDKIYLFIIMYNFEIVPCVSSVRVSCCQCVGGTCSNV
jgi:hypothetical protein